MLILARARFDVCHAREDNAAERARIDSNRRLLGLTRKTIKCIDGIGDGRIKEIDAYRAQFEEEHA